MRRYESEAEIDHISARDPLTSSAFTISVAFICTYVIFALAVIPFAQNPGPEIPGITPLFVATVFATELSTSFLLFVHFRTNPRWSLLILGSAFFYSALMVVPHLLVFPGAVLTGRPLVGGSRQAPGYIFVLWVTGFALLTFVSVLFEARASRHQFALVRVDRAICTAVSAVSVVVLSVTLIAILLGDHLPSLAWTGYSHFLILIAVAFFAGSIAIVLFSIRNELFLWLVMTLATVIIANILAEVGGARYTVGWLIARLTWMISGCVLFLYFLRQFARQQNQLVVLLAELDHRVKNILAQVAVVAVSSRQGSRSLDDFLRSLNDRIQSMAAAHTLLSKSGWQSVALDALVRNQLALYVTVANITISGTDIMLTAAKIQAVARVLHELVTNAAKHGALSISSGRVSVSWDRKPNGDGANLMLVWQEFDGPAVKSEIQSSYGTSLIRNLIPHELGGKVDLVFASDGVSCRIEIPIGQA